MRTCSSQARAPCACALRAKLSVARRPPARPGVDWRGLVTGEAPGGARGYEGWVERGNDAMQPMREIAGKHGLSMIQFASLWNLSQNPVKCVVPTVIQEAGENAIPIENKIRDYAATPADFKLSSEEVEAIRMMGDNTGCMMLKGASQRHDGPCERPDEWPMREELLTLAGQYGLTSKW